ncbi:MAG: TIM-barrel domain-containing protein [Eubacteriales bacterium]
MNDRFTSRIVSLALTVLFFFSSINIFSIGKATPEPTLAPPAWPMWVHTQWVWEHDGTSESAMKYVKDYIAHGIPVGAVNIDNPWNDEIGTFMPDPKRYPDLKEQVQLYHSMGIKVFLWATCMVNKGASNFQEGKDKGYYISNGRTIKWWSGKGAFLDFTNPEAVKWWHKQMDKALDMGIDGWKVDGADPYIMLMIPAIAYGGKLISWKTYREAFYRDFFEYTREKLGKDRVISVRPVNDLPFRIGLPIRFATRDVNFAGWVGDDDNDWGGMRGALNDMLSSSRFNYVSYGSDIGGFRSDGKKYKDVFIRWAQLGAFCPVMENGGGGEHRPWMFDNETCDIYRKFVYLHDELLPYIYSQAAYSYELVKPTMRPQLGTYEYLLGDDLLVAPIFEEGNTRTVVFPKGDWIYMFDQTKTYSAGIKKLSFGLNEYPVFIRKGAIIPMNVVNNATGHGSELSKDYTTVLMVPQTGEKKFGLYEEKVKGSMISYVKAAKSLDIKCTATARALLFKVDGEAAPQTVKNGAGEAFVKASSMAELVTLQAGYFTEGTTTWYAVKNAVAGTEIQVQY